MSRDVILTAEDGTKYSFDNIKTQGWLNGHYSGLDVAANYIKVKAVELFKAGKDEEAVKLRKLAEELVKKLEPDMRSRAERHEREFPMVIADDEE